jgi:hypothetical protein
LLNKEKMETVPNIYKQITDGEFNQAQLERQERVEEAIQRAQNFTATNDDWAVIRFECGLSAQ